MICMVTIDVGFTGKYKHIQYFRLNVFTEIKTLIIRIK